MEFKVEKEIDEENKCVTVRVNCGSYTYSYNGKLETKEEAERLYNEIKSIKEIIMLGLQEEKRKVYKQ